MKKLTRNSKTFLFFGILMLFTISYISCKEDESKKLIGKWIISSEEIQCPDPTLHAVNLPTLKVSGNEMLEKQQDIEIKSGCSYEFFADGKFYSFNIISQNGLYKLTGDTLILSSEKGFLMAKYKFDLIGDTKFKYEDEIHVPENHTHKVTYYYDKSKQ